MNSKIEDALRIVLDCVGTEKFAQIYVTEEVAEAAQILNEYLNTFNQD